MTAALDPAGVGAGFEEEDNKTIYIVMCLFAALHNMAARLHH